MDNNITTAMVAAIREDEEVGRGSCSVIDECYGEDELREALEDAGITTSRRAVAWARRLNAAYWANAREIAGSEGW